MSGAVETEVKIRVNDPDRMAERLREAGFTLSVARSFEANTLYDTSEGSLRAAGHILRLRHVAGRSIVTFKGQEQSGSHKTREEIETEVGSAAAAHTILDRLQLHPVFRYEKYRTEFKQGGDDSGVVTLDETPIGNFLELEGPGEWIDGNARRLGFGPADYVLDSYGKLYIADCERRGVQPSNMVFPS